MKTTGRISLDAVRRFFGVALLLGLLCVAAGCGSSGLATGSNGAHGQPSALQSGASCSEFGSDSSYNPRDEAPKGQPIIAGPLTVGCGSRLGEPIRFLAYVQATRNGGEHLCYVLEQKGQKAVTGGSCFQTAPSFDRCREDCPLSVEATVGPWGKAGTKGSLVTGATTGVIEEVALSTSPLGDKRVTAPLVVVLDGAVQKRLRLPSAVSLFASVVIPCLPARQAVSASGEVSGEEFAMQGSDPFGCHR